MRGGIGENLLVKFFEYFVYKNALLMDPTIDFKPACIFQKLSLFSMVELIIQSQVKFCIEVL